MEDYKKLYEDLVDRIKTMAKAQPLVTKKAIEMHFPEIVESEDERIRKELIAEVKEQIDCIPPPDCRDKEDEKALKRLDKWLTWLEKRDEQKSTQPIWKYKKEHTPLLRDSLILNKYGCVAKSPSGALVSDVWVLDYDELAKLPKEEYDKQSEQKLAGWSNVIDLISLGYLADFVDKNGDEFYGKNKSNVVKWIHSFANLTTPQQEWSEEDEERYASCLQRLGTGNPEQPETINSKWFKEHVYPQNTWKPSDEQMEALYDAAIYVKDTMFPYPKGILMELHEQLKKLK